jgi:hypothetical protein
MTETSPPSDTVLEGRDLLDLYVHRSLLAERSLATERDIVVKNYAAFGAVMLFQTGFFAQSFATPWVVIVAGVILIVISLAARAMSIFYLRYSLALYASAGAAKKAALRGRDSLYVLEKEKQYELAKLHEKSNELSFRDFLIDTTALATINTFPAVIGLSLVLAGLFLPLEALSK